MTAERTDYVVKLIKSRDAVSKTILGGSTLAMCTHFLPNYSMTSFWADVAMLLAMLFLTRESFDHAFHFIEMHKMCTFHLKFGQFGHDFTGLP